MLHFCHHLSLGALQYGQRRYNPHQVRRVNTQGVLAQQNEETFHLDTFGKASQSHIHVCDKSCMTMADQYAVVLSKDSNFHSFEFGRRDESHHQIPVKESNLQGKFESKRVGFRMLIRVLDADRVSPL